MSLAGDDVRPSKKAKTKGGFREVQASRSDDLPRFIILESGKNLYKYPVSEDNLIVGCRYEALSQNKRSMTVANLEELKILTSRDKCSVIIDPEEHVHFFPLVLPITEVQTEIISQTSRKHLIANFMEHVSPTSRLGKILSSGGEGLGPPIPASRPSYLVSPTSACPPRIVPMASKQLRSKSDLPVRGPDGVSIQSARPANPLFALSPAEARRCMLEYAVSSPSYDKKARDVAKLLERGMRDGSKPSDHFLFDMCSKDEIKASPRAEEIVPARDVDVGVKLSDVYRTVACNMQHLFNGVFSAA